MELELTSDQEFLAETTRKFLGNKAGVTSLRALRHSESGYDGAYWRDGCELGWTSLLVSEEDGGGSISGDGLADLALIAYEFGRHAAPGPFTTNNVVASALGRGGTPEQKESLLQGILAGTTCATWALSEPRPHDRLGVVTMEATEQSDGWSLTGTKLLVESGGSADVLLVTTRVDGGLAQFLVPVDAEGVSVSPMQTVDLTRRFSAVRFDGVQVPRSASVGAVGGAEAEVRHQLRIANVLQCAEMVGAMDSAMDMTLEWAHDRYSFGRPLGSYQAIKHRFADMKAWLEASHALADAAVRAVTKDDDDADELCSAAKAYIGYHGPELCHECVQFHGGIGVTFEHDLHLYLRRVTLNAALWGAVTDHRLRLADILEARSADAKEQA